MQPVTQHCTAANSSLDGALYVVDTPSFELQRQAAGTVAEQLRTFVEHSETPLTALVLVLSLASPMSTEDHSVFALLMCYRCAACGSSVLPDSCAAVCVLSLLSALLPLSVASLRCLGVSAQCLVPIGSAGPWWCGLTQIISAPPDLMITC